MIIKNLAHELLTHLFLNRKRFQDVLPKNLFQKPYRELNLAEICLKFSNRHPELKITSKDIVDPEKCAKLVQKIHKELGLVWSYGSWLENREKLLAETYLKKAKFWVHLGIDINIPVGTPVLASADGIVHLVYSDYPEEGGWGNFIIIEHKITGVKFYSIYGHLASTALANEDETVLAGEVIGRVGTTKENGFWFPHTHFQLISEMEMRHKEKPFTLDGYGSPKNLDYLRENYPNPLVVLPMGRKE